MSAELGADWQNLFSEFGHEAAAAASLGQVHRASDLEGRQIACKLQYPDMATVVEADLRQLKLVFAIFRRYDQAIDPAEVHKELSARLMEELDYRREAKHIRLYEGMLEGEGGVHVPEVIDALCGDRLLSMSWMEGISLLPYIDAHEAVEDRNRVALNMFRAWYVPFYRCGVIHGDPHLGNYTLREDGSVNLLDFGCIRVFKPSFVQGVIDLYRALRDDDVDLAVHAYEIWGFTGLTKEIIDILNLWAEFVYAPLMEDRIRPIQDQKGEYGAEVAGKVRAELNRIGGVRPPPEFVLMDRAAIGLGSVFTHLGARINWHRVFHELIDDFDAAEMAARQKSAFKKLELEPAY